MATRKVGAARGAGKTTREAPGKSGSYHHGDLKRALLDAALEQVQQEGVGTLSLREVARRAGVSQAAPYRHFASKEALLAAVAEEGFHTLRTELLLASEAVADDLIERLRQVGIAYVSFAAAHPAHFRVMFSAVQSCDYPTLDAASSSAFGVLLGAIEAGRSAGVLRDEPTMELALAAWSLVHGLASLLLEGQLPPDLGSAASLAGLVTNRLVLGLAPPPKGESPAKPRGRKEKA